MPVFNLFAYVDNFLQYRVTVRVGVRVGVRVLWLHERFPQRYRLHSEKVRLYPQIGSGLELESDSDSDSDSDSE